MITEDYVSFETAKLLKEKGFDVSCYGRYSVRSKEFHLDNTRPCNNGGISQYSAPTLQMAMKWLREVHHIYLNINVRVILGQWSGYDISIHTTDNDGFLCKKIPIVLKDNMPYEQACEAAINYCLNRLI